MFQKIRNYLLESLRQIRTYLPEPLQQADFIILTPDTDSFGKIIARVFCFLFWVGIWSMVIIGVNRKNIKNVDHPPKWY